MMCLLEWGLCDQVDHRLCRMLPNYWDLKTTNDTMNNVDLILLATDSKASTKSPPNYIFTMLAYVLCFWL